MEQRNTADLAPEYRAVFFDLDGTLLPMDIEEFMSAYLSKLGAFAAAHGADPQAFGAGMKAGIKAMARHSGDITNEQAFFDAFYDCVGEGSLDWPALLTDFYENHFPSVGEGVVPNPAAAKAVKTLAEKGYTLLLTTMPMFPLAAVKARLAWAGVDPSLFSRITTFENSCSVKPKLTYFAENLAACGLRGSDVLMVGNNSVEDLAALDLGTDGYLVTDCLIDAVGYDLSKVKHGSLAEFADWVETLPVCENPADRVEATAVSWPRVQKAYEANALFHRDEEERQRIAASAYKPMNPLKPAAPSMPVRPETHKEN